MGGTTSLFCEVFIVVAFSRVFSHFFPFLELVGSAVPVRAQPLFQRMMVRSRRDSVQAGTVGVNVAQARVTAGFSVGGVFLQVGVAILA